LTCVLIITVDFKKSYRLRVGPRCDVECTAAANSNGRKLTRIKLAFMWLNLVLSICCQTRVLPSG